MIPKGMMEKGAPPKPHKDVKMEKVSLRSCLPPSPSGWCLGDGVFEASGILIRPIARKQPWFSEQLSWCSGIKGST